MKKLFRQHYAKQSGFSTIEILVAVLILASSFGAVITLVMGSQKLSVDTETNQEFLRSSEKLLEEARVALRANFSANVYIPETTETSNGLEYKKSRSVRVISECSIEVTARYTWKVESRDQHIELKEIITNPVAAIASGGDCSPVGPPGGGGPPWNYCVGYKSKDLEDNGSQGTGIDVVKISGIRYAFITAAKNNNTPKAVTIYKVTYDNQDPELIKSFDLGEGANAIDVVKNEADGNYYAYVAMKGVENQLRILLVTDPLTASQVGQVTLGDTDATNVTFYNGKVYVASGSKLYTVNISNPVSPFESGNLDVGGVINEIAIQGNYAYLATSDDSGELKAVNLNNNAISNYPAPGIADGTAIYVAGAYAYLGRQQNNPDLEIINISNPLSMVSMGSQDLQHQPTKSVIDIIVSGGLAFIGSDSANKEFEVWDVSDPLNIVLKCTEENENPSQSAAGLDILDNVVFGAIKSNKALQLFCDKKNPPATYPDPNCN